MAELPRFSQWTVAFLNNPWKGKTKNAAILRTPLTSNGVESPEKA